MKVFARYFSDKQMNFRRDTMLQFGDSFEVIGAAVLINPGSARPVSTVWEEDLRHLRHISGKDDSWNEFAPDSTMRQLEKLFSGGYLGSPRPLCGVIRLFNLFNLREPILDEAMRLCNDCDSHNLFSTHEDIQALIGIHRVYLGWGASGRDEMLHPRALQIFNALSAGQKAYLNEHFDDNPFYHPGYINRSYKHSEVTQTLLHRFASIG